MRRIDGWMGGWMDGWMKSIDVEDPWNEMQGLNAMGGWMDGWVMKFS